MLPVALRLDRNTAEILKAVKDRGVIRGADLVRIADSADPKIDDASIVAAVRDLVKMKMVSLKGDCGSIAQLREAYLTFLPSNTAVADFAILDAM